MSFYPNRPKEELVDEIFDSINTAVVKAVPLSSLDEPDKLVCRLVLPRAILVMHVVLACSMARNVGARHAISSVD